MHTLSFEVWWDLNNPNCWQFSLQWRWDWLFKPSKAISRPTASPIIGTLSNYDDEAKKKLVLLAKQQLCTFFSTFLWRPLQDYYVKPPNATFYGGGGHTTTNFPFSIWTWKKPLRIQLQEKSPTFDELSGSKWTRLGLKGYKFMF